MMRKIVFVLLAALILVSCSQSPEEASVVLSFTEAESKDLSVSSSLAVSRYEYRVDDGSGTSSWTEFFPGSSNSVVLGGYYPGQWTFSVRLLAANGTVVFEGSKSMYLTNGSPNNVVVELRRVYGSGTGRISFNIETRTSRSRTSETLEVRYRRNGQGSYNSVLLNSVSVSQDYRNRTWTGQTGALTEGVYEVCVNLKSGDESAYGRTFTVEVRSGANVPVSGFLDGGPSEEQVTLNLSFADLIAMAERSNCTKMIVGLRDGLTGEDIAAQIMDQGSYYTMPNCPGTSVGSDWTFSTLGIIPSYYDSTSDPDTVVLRSLEFAMITESCTFGPSNFGWFAGVGKVGDNRSKLKTLYINKDLTTKYAISNLPYLSRLVLGTTFTRITGEQSFSNLPNLYLLSIPPNVTEIGSKTLNLNGFPRTAKILIALDQGSVASDCIVLNPAYTMDVTYGEYRSLQNL